MDDPNTVSPEVQDFGPSQNLLDDKPLDDSSPDAARVLDDLFSQQHVLDDVPIIQKVALSRAQSSHQSVVARHRRTRGRRSIGVGTGANRAEPSRSWKGVFRHKGFREAQQTPSYVEQASPGVPGTGSASCGISIVYW